MLGVVGSSNASLEANEELLPDLWSGGDRRKSDAISVMLIGVRQTVIEFDIAQHSSKTFETWGRGVLDIGGQV